MKILMTGATGNVGNHVGQRLVQLGHDLVVVSRSKNKAKLDLEFQAQVIEHDLTRSPLREQDIQGVEAIIHLMGETIDGRWTKEKKDRILDSREKSSQNLVAVLPSSLKTIISASAQGIYGDQGQSWVSEKTKPGNDFLASVCQVWEKSFQDLKDVRTVQLRIGLVLDPEFGVLKKVIPLFRNGLGGVLGNGKQYMSWIAIEDLTEIIVESLQNSQFSGPINCSTEHPVTNHQWTQILRQELKAWPSPSVPKFVLRIALGEMADAILASIRMKPEKLLKYNFKFKHPYLEDYLKYVLAIKRND